MLDAARQAGVAGESATFEVFTRRLPPGRRYGVFGGLGRLLDALEDFRFGPDDLAWLDGRGIVSAPTLDWLGRYRFGGDIHAYREGELYTGGSPVLTVEGSFGECVLLETLVLSILNFDSAVAAAASLVDAGRGRAPGDRDGQPADRPASRGRRGAGRLPRRVRRRRPTSRRGGATASRRRARAPTPSSSRSPTNGRPSRPRSRALGPGTTLLVDTYDTAEGIRRAVDVAGPQLDAIRIDSGDLAAEARRARVLLDSLGATRTR